MFLGFFDDASLKAPSFAIAYRRIFNVIDGVLSTSYRKINQVSKNLESQTAAMRR